MVGWVSFWDSLSDQSGEQAVVDRYMSQLASFSGIAREKRHEQNDLGLTNEQVRDMILISARRVR